MRKTLQAAVLAAILMPVSAFAAGETSSMYRLELAQQTFKAGEDVPVTVHVLKGADDKSLTDVTFDAPELLMVMPGMEDMMGNADPLDMDASGNYRFAADLVAPGEWKLTLTAHIPNEATPVTQTLHINVE